MKPPFTILPLVTDMKYGRARVHRAGRRFHGNPGQATLLPVPWHLSSSDEEVVSNERYRTKATRIDDRQWRRRVEGGGIGVFFLIVVNWFGRDWFPLVVGSSSKRVNRRDGQRGDMTSRLTLTGVIFTLCVSAHPRLKKWWRKTENSDPSCWTPPLEIEVWLLDDALFLFFNRVLYLSIFCFRSFFILFFF